MMQLQVTSKFKKDYKRCKKRGLDMGVLQDVIESLLNGETLDAKHRDHSLSGEYQGFRECHVQPDWLLIYRISKDRLILTAVRTGTHSELLDI